MYPLQQPGCWCWIERSAGPGKSARRTSRLRILSRSGAPALHVPARHSLRSPSPRGGRAGGGSGRGAFSPRTSRVWYSEPSQVLYARARHSAPSPSPREERAGGGPGRGAHFPLVPSVWSLEDALSSNLFSSDALVFVSVPIACESDRTAHHWSRYYL